MGMWLEKYKKSSIIGEKEIIDLSLLIIFSVFLFIFTRINTYPIEIYYAKLISIFIGTQHGNIIIYGNAAFQIGKFCLGFISASLIIFLFLIDRKINIYFLISILLISALNLIRIISSIFVNNSVYHIIFNYSMIIFSIMVWLFFRRF